MTLGGSRTRDLAHVGARSCHVLRTGSRRCIRMPNEGLPRAFFVTAVRTSEQVAGC